MKKETAIYAKVPLTFREGLREIAIEEDRRIGDCIRIAIREFIERRTGKALPPAHYVQPD